MDESSFMIAGQIVSSQVCVLQSDMIHELEIRGYGEKDTDSNNEKLILKTFEALYLLYTGRMTLTKSKKKITFDSFIRMCQKSDSDTLTKFLIYRDLRNRGYVVKDGFGFGSDFRVYERGHFGQKGAKFLVFGFSEGYQEKIGSLQKKIEEITHMGKDPIIAVIERRGEVIYYKISKMIFRENIPVN